MNLLHCQGMIAKWRNQFCCRIWLKVPHCIYLSYDLSLLWSVTVFQSFFVFHDLDNLEEYWPGSLQNVPNLVCLLLFSWLELDMSFGKNLTGVMCSSLHIILEGIWDPHDIAGNVNIHHLVKVVFSRPIYYRVTIFPFLYSVLPKWITKSSPSLGGGQG